jgi:hypothetical protein
LPGRPVDRCVRLAPVTAKTLANGQQTPEANPRTCERLGPGQFQLGVHTD